MNATVHRCLEEKAPRYLVDCCTPVSDVIGNRQLCSASQQHLNVSSVVVPNSWNSFPVRLRNPTLSSGSFRGN